MPYEKDVQERQYWWCPKWYWPFAICSGIRQQHKYCYNFAWVKETNYAFVAHLEGCEDGKLYTWTEATFSIGSTTHPAGEMCFDSSRGADEGRCDPSRTGLLASGLSPSAPYASSIDFDVQTLSSTAAESGEFAFTGEHETLCQKGLWSWQRTLHKQVVTASVVIRFATVQWYIGGVPIAAGSGTATIGTECRWPFPLPDGRSQYRTVNLNYTLVTNEHGSTITVTNDPSDGGFSVVISMNASDGGNQFSSSTTWANFNGETCDFEPQNVEGMLKCWGRYLKERLVGRKPGIRDPLGPVAMLPEEIWRMVPDGRREQVETLLNVMGDFMTEKPQELSYAVAQLRQLSGIPDVSRFLYFRSADGATSITSQGQCRSCSAIRSLGAAVIAVATGLVVGAILF